MRKPLLSLAVVAVVASGCATASAPTSGRYVAPPPEHHLETPPVQEVPRGTPYDGVTFQDPGVNPFVDPLKDNQSTFGLDVDTASYTVARRFVDDGNLPDPASVRVEEFVNYFDQGYAPPQQGDFAIHVDGGPGPCQLPPVALLAKRRVEDAEPAGERSSSENAIAQRWKHPHTAT